jgi:nucleoside phosphorylase
MFSGNSMKVRTPSSNNPAWDYGSGKHCIIDGSDVFEPAPFPLPLTTRVRGILDSYEGENDTIAGIRNGFHGARPATAARLHVGPFASGAAVVARSAIMKEVQSQNRKLVGIDMEAYGLVSAAAELPAPQPDFLVLKGVSDFADEEKGDAYREYAAYVSAQFLAHLCTHGDLC